MEKSFIVGFALSSFLIGCLLQNPELEQNTSPKDSLISPKDSVVSPKDSVVSPKDSVVSPKDSLISPKDSVANKQKAVVKIGDFCPLQTGTMWEFNVKSATNSAWANVHSKAEGFQRIEVVEKIIYSDSAIYNINVLYSQIPSEDTAKEFSYLTNLKIIEYRDSVMKVQNLTGTKNLDTILTTMFESRYIDTLKLKDMTFDSLTRSAFEDSTFNGVLPWPSYSKHFIKLQGIGLYYFRVEEGFYKGGSSEEWQLTSFISGDSAIRFNKTANIDLSIP